MLYDNNTIIDWMVDNPTEFSIFLYIVIGFLVVIGVAHIVEVFKR